MTDLNAPPGPPSRLPRWIVPTIVALAAVALVSTAVGVTLAATRNTAPVPAAAPAVSAATSAAMLSVRDACVQLDPLLVQSARMLTDYERSGVTPSREQASTLRAALREIQKVAPADMSDDIGQNMKGVSLLPAGGAGISFDDWKYALQTLNRTCKDLV